MHPFGCIFALNIPSIHYRFNATEGNVTIEGSGSSLNVSGNVTHQLSFAGTGAASATIAQGATVNYVRFNGTGTYALDNYGTISHTQSASNPFASEHTVSTIKACNITINNYGKIEAKKNASGICSYAMLFYGGCTVVVNEYSGSKITADVNGCLLACGSANSVIYYTRDGSGNITSTSVKK